jgi:hypothetical protein
MQNRSMIKSFSNDRVAAQVTLGHLIGPWPVLGFPTLHVV